MTRNARIAIGIVGGLVALAAVVGVIVVLRGRATGSAPNVEIPTTPGTGGTSVPTTPSTDGGQSGTRPQGAQCGDGQCQDGEVCWIDCSPSAGFFSNVVVERGTSPSSITFETAEPSTAELDLRDVSGAVAATASSALGTSHTFSFSPLSGETPFSGAIIATTTAGATREFPLTIEGASVLEEPSGETIEQRNARIKAEVFAEGSLGALIGDGERRLLTREEKTRFGYLVEAHAVATGRAGLDPLVGYVPDGGDRDMDGLTDEQEEELGTDPAKPDSDGDGLTDGFEVVLLDSDPLDPEDN